MTSFAEALDMLAEDATAAEVMIAVIPEAGETLSEEDVVRAVDVVLSSDLVNGVIAHLSWDEVAGCQVDVRLWRDGTQVEPTTTEILGTVNVR